MRAERTSKGSGLGELLGVQGIRLTGPVVDEAPKQQGPANRHRPAGTSYLAASGCTGSPWWVLAPLPGTASASASPARTPSIRSIPSTVPCTVSTTSGDGMPTWAAAAGSSAHAACCSSGSTTSQLPCTGCQECHASPVSAVQQGKHHEPASVPCPSLPCPDTAPCIHRAHAPAAPIICTTNLKAGSDSHCSSSVSMASASSGCNSIITSSFGSSGQRSMRPSSSTHSQSSHGEGPALAVRPGTTCCTLYTYTRSCSIPSALSRSSSIHPQPQGMLQVAEQQLQQQQQLPQQEQLQQQQQQRQVMHDGGHAALQQHPTTDNGRLPAMCPQASMPPFEQQDTQQDTQQDKRRSPRTAGQLHLPHCTSTQGMPAASSQAGEVHSPGRSAAQHECHCTAGQLDGPADVDSNANGSPERRMTSPMRPAASPKRHQRPSASGPVAAAGAASRPAAAAAPLVAGLLQGQTAGSQPIKQLAAPAVVGSSRHVVAALKATGGAIALAQSSQAAPSKQGASSHSSPGGVAEVDPQGPEVCRARQRLHMFRQAQEQHAARAAAEEAAARAARLEVAQQAAAERERRRIHLYAFNAVLRMCDDAQAAAMKLALEQSDSDDPDTGTKTQNRSSESGRLPSHNHAV